MSVAQNGRSESRRIHQRRATLASSTIIVLVVMFVLARVDALSMVSSSSLGRTSHVRIPTAQPSVTSSLVSRLAVMALKLRLYDQSGVNCDVTASSSDLLLKGKVGPVTVKGRAWQSRLGLTCRAIQATVESCDLDMSQVFRSQKLVLSTPAHGSAMVALSSDDFGNFITHPLMKPPGLLEESDKERIKFLKQGVSIHDKTGTVSFFGTHAGETFKCTLQRGPGSTPKAVVHVESQKKDDLHSTCLQLQNVISNFFNEMVFELDGTYLTFRDLMVTSKGAEPTVMLSLGITVKKFPSPGLAF